MPKLLSHTPAWLSRPSIGFQAFQSKEQGKIKRTISNGHGKSEDYSGPTRTIANRGTEIFFVVDNNIRWVDLAELKDLGDGASQLKQSFLGTASTSSINLSAKDEDVQNYSRILKVPITGQIRQLIMSPLGDFMAIATSHTIHVAILPKRLDPELVKLKTFQLGPTAHVLEQAPLKAALWHPLGVLGSCLVTIASDACVRLWEINIDSRYSFDEPALALDLKKLANASSYGEDVRASVYGTSKGFSPDLIEMEVAAAAFGGIGSKDESGWAAMTLWVAMSEGDVYALCPLLPSRFQPSSTTIASISASISVKVMSDDLSAEDRRNVVQQQKWISDVEDQDAVTDLLPGGLESVSIYQRPSHPSAIPKLQGPFKLSPESDMDEISDILAVAPRLSQEILQDESQDENDDGHNMSLSSGLVLILTRSGLLHVCLDINDVEAAWLPARKSHFQIPSLTATHLNMLVLEIIQLTASTHTWPSLTASITHRYCLSDQLYNHFTTGKYFFYVTNDSGVFTCDLSSWLSNLEEELDGPSDTGASFRIGLLHESEKSSIEHVINTDQSNTLIPAAISLLNIELGHFIMTSTDNQPLAAVLDLPFQNQVLDSFAPSSQSLLLHSDIREPYLPARDFFINSTLSSFIENILQSGNTRLKRADLKSQIRLSPATLQLLTEAHRILSTETNKLGLAAADLFRRCQRMQAELAEQVRRVSDISNRTEAIAPLTSKDDKTSVDGRIKKLNEHNESLLKRVEAMRRKVAHSAIAGKQLSLREQAWTKEVDDLEATLDESDQGLYKRLEAIKTLKNNLIAKSKEITQQDDKAVPNHDGIIPNEIRRRRLDQVMSLLDRETALVNAVTDRLEKLGGLTSDFPDR